MSLRDPEFIETLDSFYATSRLDMQGRTPVEKVCRAFGLHGATADVNI